jgi:hypothetical protein
MEGVGSFTKGKNLEEAAWLMESSQVVERRPRRTGSAAGFRPVGRQEVHGGLPPESGWYGRRRVSLREGEAQEGKRLSGNA